MRWVLESHSRLADRKIVAAARSQADTQAHSRAPVGSDSVAGTSFPTFGSIRCLTESLEQLPTREVFFLASTFSFIHFWAWRSNIPARKIGAISEFELSVKSECLAADGNSLRAVELPFCESGVIR